MTVRKCDRGANPCVRVRIISARKELQVIHMPATLRKPIGAWVYDASKQQSRLPSKSAGCKVEGA